MDEVYATVIRIEYGWGGKGKTLVTLITDVEMDAGGGCMEPIMLSKTVIDSEVSKYARLLHRTIKINLSCNVFLSL